MAMILIEKVLILAGAALLVAALLPVRRLLVQLPAGRVRRSWFVLATLILLFIVGYVVFAATLGDVYVGPTDLLVPAVFFFGACFVWLVNTLSLATALDVRRISVLEQENITDPLMGIYNRRYMERRLKEEIAKARRYDSPIATLLLDIDHFKRINDSFGHPFGDVVLQQLGNLIANKVRVSDIVARYGGEEILVIAANTDEAGAVIVAERLRRAVEAMNIAAPGEQAIALTVSIGVAVFDIRSDDMHGLLKRTDDALYRAKEEGRNRVVFRKAP